MFHFSVSSIRAFCLRPFSFSNAFSVFQMVSHFIHVKRFTFSFSAAFRPQNHLKEVSYVL